jgi:hypothetical protein
MRSKEERAAAQKAVQFKPGQSGNPGGAVKLAKAWKEACGMTKAGVTAEALRMVRERMLEGPNGDPKGDADWRFATQKVLDYSAGPPKQEIELSGSVETSAQFDASAMSDEEIAAALEAIRTLKGLAVVPANEDSQTEH